MTQKTAWYLCHRIREAFADVAPVFERPVEVDESCFGGKRANMSNARRKELEGTGRGTVGKTAVVGMKDRATKQVVAKVIDRTDQPTLQGFVEDHADPGATLYTDDATAYKGTGREHETVKHSVAATRTAWSPSGRCSSERTKVSTTSSAPSIFKGT